MPLEIHAYTESWGISGMMLCQTSHYPIRLDQGLLPAYSVNANPVHEVVSVWDRPE